MAADVFAEAGADARQLQVAYTEVADTSLPPSADDELAAALPPTVRSAFKPPRHVVLSPEMSPDQLPPRPAVPGFLSVAGFPDMGGLVEVLEGRMPRPGSPERELPPAVGAAYDESNRGLDEPTRGRAEVVEVIIERSAARELDLPVGAWVELSSTSYQGVDTLSAVLHVVGTYRAAAPAPTPIDDADTARKPSIDPTPDLKLVRATALAADVETVLQATWEEEPQVRWTFDLQGNPGAEAAGTLVQEMRKVELQAFPPVVDAAGFTTVSGVGDLAQRVLAERRTSDGVLALALTALGAAALTVLLAAAVVLAGRRRDVTTVVRARGASSAWLVLQRGGEALLVTLPGVLVALGVVRLVGGSLRLADVVVALTAAGACTALITAAQTVPRGGAGGRLQAVLRDAAQLVVVGLAVAVTVLVLLDDELAADDPVLLAVPVLVGAAAAVLLTRVLQVGLTALRRTVRGTRRVTPVVSLSQASDLARQVVLASAAVVLAASSGWLTIAAGDTLRTGAERTGWEQVGADTAVRTNGFHDDTIARLADVPGVEGVAPVATSGSVSLDTRTGVEGVALVATDVASLRAVGGERLRDLELPPAPEGELTVVVSSDLDLESDRTTLRYAQSMIPVRIVDRIDQVPGVTDGSFVLADIGALTTIVDRRLDFYSTVLMAGDPATEDVREVARSVDPLAVVESRASVTQDVLDRPATARTLTMLTVTGGATTALSVFAVLLMVGLGAPTRRRTGVVLGAIGADARQVRRVNVVALVPIVLAACAAAAACGVLLTGIVDRGFDLASLTATQGDLAVRPTTGTALVVAGALAALVAAAALLARRGGRTTDIVDHLDQEQR
jgi:putative ABC transport system permease protein